MSNNRLNPLPSLRRHRLLPALGLLTAVAFGASLNAQTIKTWTAGTADFFGAANWSPSGAPVVSQIGLINNGGTATIDLGAGTAELGTIRLGDTQNGQVSGHVIMNSGTLIIGNTSGDPKAVIGFSAQLSTFIMNGGTILFDGPDRDDLAGDALLHHR